MAGSKRRQCDKCWLRVLQILFSQNSSQSARGRVGASPRSIMISNWAWNYLSSDPKKCPTPVLSEPGLSALFWSTVLSGAKIFFSTFFVTKTTEHDEGGALWRAGFLSRKKTEKGQISAARRVTRWRIWRLWFWYTTQVNKKNGACHPSGPANRPVSAIHRRSGERNFFFNLDQEKAEVA